MYETYPSKKHHKKYGGDLPAGNPSKTSYPNPGLPTTKDDRRSTANVSQSQGSIPGNTKSNKGNYAKGGACGHKCFPGLGGLPS